MNLEGLSYFLNKLLSKFAVLGHTHMKSEITDLIIDNTINSTSENPVQNKAIYTALSTKQTIGDYALKNDIPITVNVIEENNINPVSSSAVYEAFKSIEAISDDQINAICGTVIYQADEAVL